MTSNEKHVSDEIQLLMFLDGEADPQTAEHLETCLLCCVRAEGLRMQEARLKTAFYRNSCPKPLTLGEYRLGTLERDQVAGVTRHVAACPHCGRELARLERFLDDLAPAAEPAWMAEAVERIRVRVARWVGGVRMR